jgi:hypothetical protein
LSASLLDDGVNVGVELAELFNLSLGLLKGSSVGVHVSSFTEEFSTETFMGVNIDSVLVAVVSSGSILAQEGNLPDEVTALNTLGGGRLL